MWMTSFRFTPEVYFGDMIPSPDFASATPISLKETGICWSKVAVIAALAIGVEEFYFSGIYKFLQKITDGSGKEYECSRKNKLDFCWIFDDSGLYAAAVHKSGWFLSVFVYDSVEKKAYQYLNQLNGLELIANLEFQERSPFAASFMPEYFYWLNGDLVLIHIEQGDYIKQVQLKLDHNSRKAKIVKTRDYNFPYVSYEDGIVEKPHLKKWTGRPLTECLETAIFNGTEYIILQNCSCITVVMIPKDPNSVFEPRLSLSIYPEDDEIRVTEVKFQDLQPIAHQQFHYYPKMSEIARREDQEEKYILDGFIEITLEEQQNVLETVINADRIYEERNHTGRNVVFSHVGTVPENISLPRTVITSKRFGNGKVLAVLEEDHLKRRYSCLIDVGKKQIEWRNWLPRIQKNSNMILSSLHSSEYYLDIFYKKKHNEDKYKLFCKVSKKPDDIMKLRTLALVRLFTNNIHLTTEQIKMLRTIL